MLAIRREQVSKEWPSVSRKVPLSMATTSASPRASAHTG